MTLAEKLGGKALPEKEIINLGFPSAEAFVERHPSHDARCRQKMTTHGVRSVPTATLG